MFCCATIETSVEPLSNLRELRGIPARKRAV
jgi:hypothetical protein